jgi:hypothetical protein
VRSFKSPKRLCHWSRDPGQAQRLLVDLNRKQAQALDRRDGLRLLYSLTEGNVGDDPWARGISLGGSPIGFIYIGWRIRNGSRI